MNQRATKSIAHALGACSIYGQKIGARMINARAETILEKPTFKRLVTNKRILVIWDGFYEWQKIEDGKQPLRIMMKDGSLFGIARL
jgi:putative SOS response-associated peptidase YedK